MSYNHGGLLSLLKPSYPDYLDIITELELRGLHCGSAGEISACIVGGLGLIPGLGRVTGEGKDYPLQFSGLENSVDSQVTDPDLPVSIQESLAEVWISCGL